MKQSLFSWLAVFVAGFVAGVAFSAWKLDRTAVSVPAPTAQVADRNPSAEALARLAGLEKMTAANPDNVQALVELGNTYFDLDKHQKAVEAYEKAIKLDPKNPDVITDMGISLRRLGRFQESAAAFQKAAEVDPNHALALFNLGIVLRDDLKDDRGALKAWEAFLQKAGETPHAVMVKPWVAQLKKKIGTAGTESSDKN
ncbi:MAG: tetratricopeptide repeat protein [Desulfomonile tiedjei]|nr:tetratricopeptide repeat protein [Desulfomonile tiedjei]